MPSGRPSIARVYVAAGRRPAAAERSVVAAARHSYRDTSAYDRTAPRYQAADAPTRAAVQPDAADDPEEVLWVLADLRRGVDDDQRADGVARRRLVDRRVVRVPVGRRVELRAELIGGEVVRGRLEAVAGEVVGLVGLRVDGRLEARCPEALPDGDVRRDPVRQVDVARLGERAVVRLPQAAVALRGGSGRRQEHGERGGQGRARNDPHMSLPRVAEAGVSPFIGAPGFEPGTSPTRTARATRLRHAPMRTPVSQARAQRARWTAR